MAEIEELREQLDEVDRKIADLFEQRMQIGRELGACKLQNGIKMIDRQRERDKLADMAGRASTEFNKKGIRELFEQMMSMNRKVHYQQMVEAGALGRLPFRFIACRRCADRFPGDGRGLQPGGDAVLLWRELQ